MTKLRAKPLVFFDQTNHTTITMTPPSWALATASRRYLDTVEPSMPLSAWEIGRFQYPPSRVEEVVDGDSIIVDLDLPCWHKATERLRIRWYNAPELSHDGGEEARQYLDGLLSQNVVYVRTFKRKKDLHEQETFTRLVADVYVEVSGFLYDLAVIMVSSGYATWRQNPVLHGK